MRIGILSYPMLFQRDGRLQTEVRETLKALNRLPMLAGGGVLDAELVDPCRARLDEYDVVHVFGAHNGNDRIVEAAFELGVPVVLSALLAPGWNRANGACARIAGKLLGTLLGKLLGKRIGCAMPMPYGQTRHALHLASLIVAQDAPERQAIGSAFLIDLAKVRVLPGGISTHFFNADGTLFRARTGIDGKFALMVGAVSPSGNQLGVARALATMAVPLVVIGDALACDAAYLRALRGVPGVTCMGALHLQQRLLASAYAAASVFVLPGRGDGAALAACEALAAGTAVLMPATTMLQLPHSEFALKTVRWNDGPTHRSTLLGLLEAAPERERVRALVRHLTWDSVALQLADCYADSLKLARSAHGTSDAPAQDGTAAQGVPR